MFFRQSITGIKNFVFPALLSIVFSFELSKTRSLLSDELFQYTKFPNCCRDEIWPFMFMHFTTAFCHSLMHCVKCMTLCFKAFDAINGITWAKLCFLVSSVVVGGFCHMNVSNVLLTMLRKSFVIQL